MTIKHIWLALTLASLGPTAFAKHSVCTVTINSHQERDLFRAKLPANDFGFTELTSFQPKDPTAPADAWLSGACQAGVQCDVLVVSGHFGGYFFGDNTDLRLNLDPMENHACQKSCEGIVKRPKEVFLFGCNTLAEKTKDRRTPEEYLHVLIEDHIPPVQARQIVQARYGTLGDSNRDRMRRIFSGVPRIYGFDSIGPAGSSVAPFLTSYLKTTGDYGRHLSDIEGQAAVAALGKVTARAGTPAQRTIASSFRSTAFAQCAGLDANDPEYRMKAKICPLYNDQLDFSTRLGYARTLLQGDDAALLAPSVMAFVRNNEAGAVGNPVLTTALREFGADPKVRTLIDQMTNAAGNSPQLRLDLERFKLLLGVTTREQALAVGHDFVAPMFKGLTRKNLGQFCETASALGEDVDVMLTADDVDLKKVATQIGTAAFACAHTADPRVMAAALKSLDGVPKDKSLVTPQILALTQMKADPAARVKAFAPFVESKDAYTSSLVNLVTFRDGEGPARRDAFRRLVTAGRDAATLVDIIKKYEVRGEDLARTALDTAHLDQPHAKQAGQLASLLLPASSPVWIEALTKNDETVRAELFRGMTGRNVHDPKVTDWVLAAALRGEIGDSLTAPVFQWASGVNLDAGQTARAVEAIRAYPNASATAYLRALVKTKSSTTVTADARAVLAGETKAYACTATGDGQGYSCSGSYDGR